MLSGMFNSHLHAPAGRPALVLNLIVQPTVTLELCSLRHHVHLNHASCALSSTFTTRTTPQ